MLKRLNPLYRRNTEDEPSLDQPGLGSPSVFLLFKFVSSSAEAWIPCGLCVSCLIHGLFHGF
jgi:hypothetical protein